MGTKRKDYLPTIKANLLIWLIAFLKALVKNVNHYGINQEEIKSVETGLSIFQEDLNNETLLINKKRTQVKKTQEDRLDISRKVRALVQVIKASSEYSEQAGEEFDIVGDERNIDVPHSKPVIKAQIVPHGWELSFKLDSYFSGVNIYRKRPDETDFSYLATDTRSPYVDNEPMVNGTIYHAYYILGDTEVGLISDNVTIKV